MITDETASIDSIAKASRYLSGIGGVAFDEALRRVEAKSSADVADKLRGLARWLGGDTGIAPSPELSLIGHVVKFAPKGNDTSQAIEVADLALADARTLADHVRSGLTAGVGYAALLLCVATLVSLLWYFSIAPQFDALFAEMDANLPALSRFLIDQPWIFFAGLAVLALALIGAVIATRRLARQIETVGPAVDGWGRLDSGLRDAYARWRTLTLARAFAAGGSGPVDAVVMAAEVSGAGPAVASGLRAEMQLADALGAARSELDYQTQAGVGALRDALETRRAVGLRVLQLGIALLVGVIVIAIYLPIFRLGAVV